MSSHKEELHNQSETKPPNPVLVTLDAGCSHSAGNSGESSSRGSVGIKSEAAGRALQVQLIWLIKNMVISDLLQCA